MLIFFALAVFIAVAASGFALQNAEPVSVRFLTWEFTASLALVLFSTFALGALGALLACIPAMIRERWRARDLQRRLTAAEGASAAPPAEKPAPGSPRHDPVDPPSDIP